MQFLSDLKLIFGEFFNWHKALTFPWKRILKVFFAFFFCYLIGLASIIWSKMPPIIIEALSNKYQPFQIENNNGHLTASFQVKEKPFIIKQTIENKGNKEIFYLIYNDQPLQAKIMDKLKNYIFIGKEGLILKSHDNTYQKDYDTLFAPLKKETNAKLTIDLNLIAHAFTMGILFLGFIFTPPCFIGIVPFLSLIFFSLMFMCFSWVISLLHNNRYTPIQVFKVMLFTSPYFFIIHLMVHIAEVAHFWQTLGLIGFMYFIYLSLPKNNKIG